MAPPKFGRGFHNTAISFPQELVPYISCVGVTGIEPVCLAARLFESRVYTYFHHTPVCPFSIPPVATKGLVSSPRLGFKPFEVTFNEVQGWSNCLHFTIHCDDEL
jgi:hypothetical protein